MLGLFKTKNKNKINLTINKYRKVEKKKGEIRIYYCEL
jgi:hypothetical protein